MLVTRSFARTVAPALALVLSLSIAVGCGSDDSSGSASEEDRVKQIFDDWQDDFTTGKGEETCARLTKSGRDELLAYRDAAGSIDPDATCPEIVSAIIRATDKAGVKQQPAKAVSVRVDGDKAVAQVSDAGRPPVPVRLVKEDGKWKLPSAGFGPLTGGTDGG